MKKFAVLVLGLTLIWTNNVYSMDKELDTEGEGHSISMTQNSVGNQSFHKESKEEEESLSTTKNLHKVIFEELYWMQVERNVKDVSLGCLLGALSSLVLFGLIL